MRHQKNVFNQAMAEIDRLTPSIAAEERFVGLMTFLRAQYLNRELSSADRAVIQRAGLSVPDSDAAAWAHSEELRSFVESGTMDWGNWEFHLRARLHLDRFSTPSDFDLLFKLVPAAMAHRKHLEQVVSKGSETAGASAGMQQRFYDLSILPLNLLLGDSVARYFIPPDDYFQPHETNKSDPYGIVQGKSRAKSSVGKPTAVVDDIDRRLLGAHKFSHTFLLNLDFYCPIGCSDCYKTRMGTREYVVGNSVMSPHEKDIYFHPELGQLRPPNRSQAVRQVEQTVNWMNQHERGGQVHDVIVSGGEPLCIPNRTWKSMLSEFENARNLRILRICTGTIFLGLPMRIDDEFVNMLADFSDRTGVRVTIQAHLGNHQMISPESVIAVQKLRRRGIPIYSQVPIKNGINFFLGDTSKTLASLTELGRRQVLIGVEPYMFIVDMHPSTNAFYVPLEPLLAVWGELVESHDLPGLERPRTLSILFEQGNVILSGSTLLCMEKDVNRSSGTVTYRIPRVGIQRDGQQGIREVFEYQEPLGPFNADPDSLVKLRRTWKNRIPSEG